MLAPVDAEQALLPVLFALSNSGNYPCNLLVGAANVATGSYSITLTAGVVVQPFTITFAVATPTAITLSNTSLSFVGTANANTLEGAVTVATTVGTYAGPITLTGTGASSFTLSNGGVYPCNLLIGATDIAGGTYSITLAASPITQPFSITITVVVVTAIALSATSISLPTFNANAFVATITITATGGTYAGPVTLGGTDAALFALSNGGIYPCNLQVGATSILTRTYNISLAASTVTQPFSLAITAVVTPAFVPTADGIPADIYMDFVNGNYFGASVAGPTPPAWAFTRASVAWGDNLAGVWTQFASGAPVITNKGLIVCPGATNLALQCRDMTQAAWVKTTMTAAKTQIGIDGTANSASLLTATAANATVLQTITNASSSTITSFFLQRVTGTGTVNITMNGGTTWTAVTLTTSFQRFQVPLATLANPSIGIQIVTSGDAVIADFAQCEVAGSTVATPTTPILTTTTTAARANDKTVVSVPGLGSGTAVTVLCVATPFGGQLGNNIGFQACDGTQNNRMSNLRVTTNARGIVSIGGTATNLTIATAWPDGAVGKLASAATSGAAASCFDAGTVVTGTPTGYPSFTAAPQLNFGASNGAAGIWYISSAAAWLNYKASNAALQALTGLALTVTLSTNSVTFPSATDANSFVANVSVTVASGTYSGTLSLSGPDASKFVLSNGGVYPCNLMVGPSNIAAGTYNISITAA